MLSFAQFFHLTPGTLSKRHSLTACIQCLFLQTWRDVQHIVVEGVRPIEELANNVEWTVNGVGKWHSQYETSYVM